MRQQIIEAMRLATKNWDAHYFLPLSNTIGSRRRRRRRSFPHALQLACNLTAPRPPTTPSNKIQMQTQKANTSSTHTTNEPLLT